MRKLTNLRDFDHFFAGDSIDCDREVCNIVSGSCDEELSCLENFESRNAIPRPPEPEIERAAQVELPELIDRLQCVSSLTPLMECLSVFPSTTKCFVFNC